MICFDCLTLIEYNLGAIIADVLCGWIPTGVSVMRTKAYSEKYVKTEQLQEVPEGWEIVFILLKNMQLWRGKP